MRVYCNCEDWKLSVPQIVSAQSLSWAHSMKYTGKPFRFCPWCAQELKVTDGPEEVKPISKEEIEKLKSIAKSLKNVYEKSYGEEGY